MSNREAVKIGSLNVKYEGEGEYPKYINSLGNCGRQSCGFGVPTETKDTLRVPGSKVPVGFVEI